MSKDRGIRAAPSWSAREHEGRKSAPRTAGRAACP